MRRAGASVDRVARACLGAHVTLSMFSAVAFATFLGGAPPAWLQSPANQRLLAIGWRFGPPTTVVLGALAALLHASGHLGARRAGRIFAGAFAVSLCAELLGTSTGYPFGPYSYTTLLGYRIGGLVPFNIPTSWFYMLYCSLAIVGRLRRDEADAARAGWHAWRWAALAAVVLTAWDVSMDPAMVRTSHWLWHLAPSAEQSTIQRLFVSDLFYGMPLSNWLGWLLVGTLVARLMLAVVPAAEWTRRVAPNRFPLLLYAANGVLPITICARNGMWWAAVLGTAAMGIPIALAVRAGARSAQPATDRRGALDTAHVPSMARRRESA